MASKSKRRRQNRLKLGFWQIRRRRLAALTVLGVLCGLGAYSVYARAQHAHRLELAIQVQDEIRRELDATLHDDRYPNSVRSKFRELIAQNAAHRLFLNISTRRMDLTAYTLAWSELDSRPPVIGIQMERFRQLQQSEGADEFRSTVMITLYHEMVHLEKWPLSAVPAGPALLDEEVRAYGRTSLEIVRPLRQNGVPVMSDYAGLDDLLWSCRDDLKCPAFRAAVKRYGF